MRRAGVVSGRGREGGGRLVYSTGPEGSRQQLSAGCRRCGRDPCRCEPQASRPAADHDVRVGRERGGRKGKTVTVAGPFLLTRPDATELLKRLKNRCAGGGTARVTHTQDGEACFELELQGDQIDAVLAELTARGYPAKSSGG